MCLSKKNVNKTGTSERDQVMTTKNTRSGSETKIITTQPSNDHQKHQEKIKNEKYSPY
jgi:hypothetical protein